MSVLLLDSRDSFTHNIAHAFGALKVPVQIQESANQRASHLVATMQKNGHRLLCIGPGPRAPEDVAGLLDLVRGMIDEVPILGVCLGLQALVKAFGGEIGRALEPVHGKRRSITHDGEGLFAELPKSLEVMRYHSLVAKELPALFEATAWDETRQVMAIRAREMNVRAVQFHPESIGTPHGLKIFSNALKCASVQHAQPRGNALGSHWTGNVTGNEWR